jgi:hypothetical protein
MTEPKTNKTSPVTRQIINYLAGLTGGFVASVAGEYTLRKELDSHGALGFILH